MTADLIRKGGVFDPFTVTLFVTLNADLIPFSNDLTINSQRHLSQPGTSTFVLINGLQLIYKALVNYALLE